MIIDLFSKSNRDMNFIMYYYYCKWSPTGQHYYSTNACNPAYRLWHLGSSAAAAMAWQLPRWFVLLFDALDDRRTHWAIVVDGVLSHVAPESKVKNDWKGPNPSRIASDLGYPVSCFFLTHCLWLGIVQASAGTENAKSVNLQSAPVDFSGGKSKRPNYIAFAIWHVRALYLVNILGAAGVPWQRVIMAM